MSHQKSVNKRLAAMKAADSVAKDITSNKSHVQSKAKRSK